MSKRLYLYIGLPLLAAFLIVYSLFDPATTSWMPKCPVHELTGWSCPGCGSQRALHALLHGNFEGLYYHNALLLILIPFLALLTIAELNRRRWPRLYRNLTSPAVILLTLGFIVGWTVVRNIYGL